MIELLFVVCSLAHTDECKTVARQFTDITLMQCQTGAQVYLAQYAAQHPTVFIDGYECKVVNLSDQTL